MMELGELGPPSIPIQVADAPPYWVGCTVGTTQSPVTAEKVVPVAIWPDQLVDSDVKDRPPTCGSGPERKSPGWEWNCAGAMTEPWPSSAHDVACAMAVCCAPATDGPMTRPTATSAVALSHLHMRKDPGKSSASPVRYEPEPG